MINTHQINIRDPFVVPVPGMGKYFMTGTNGATTWEGAGHGFDFYLSADLEFWEGPFPAFRPPPGFWGKTNFWAPEVHFYNDHWYLFASFKSEERPRGTQILKADSITGPYTTISENPQTPGDWECLDGTLFVDEDENPWMVFCHEWVQVEDGEICAIQLSNDLTHAVSDPFLLFRASEAPWVTDYAPGKYVTDGPFLYRASNQDLLMIWSSFHNGDYALGIARSASGSIQGAWEQLKEPLFSEDGGHGMVFRAFDGHLMLTLHQPNETTRERPVFFELSDIDGCLVRGLNNLK